MLDKVADFYDQEVDTATESLTAAIEPIMVVLMGGIVGVDGRLPVPADVHHLPAHPRSDLVTRTKGMLCAGVVAALIGCAAVPAGADTIPDGSSAYAGAVAFSPGGINASIDASGALADLIAPFVDPVLDRLSGSLVPTVDSLSTSITTQLSALSSNSSLQATSPSAQAADPAPNWPSCTDGTFSSSTCYLASNVGASGGSLVSLNIPTVRGYTLADANGGQALSGRAETTHPDLSVLGVDIGDLGAITASSSCDTAGSPIADPAGASSLTGMNLLGGAVTATVSAGAMNVAVNGAPLTGTASVPFGSSTVQVTADGSSVDLSIPLSLSDLLDGLGSSAPAGITDIGDSALALTVKLGPGISNKSDGTVAWGLEAEVGLNGTLDLGIAGLATATLSIAPTGGVDPSANLLDLGLAVTNCTTASGNDGTENLPPMVI